MLLFFRLTLFQSQKFPVRVPVFVICLAELKAKPDANHANTHPSMTGRVEFTTSTAPQHPSQIWFQIRHHQDKSRANGRDQFACVMTAILANWFSEDFSGCSTVWLTHPPTGLGQTPDAGADVKQQACVTQDLKLLADFFADVAVIFLSKFWNAIIPTPNLQFPCL